MIINQSESSSICLLFEAGMTKYVLKNKKKWFNVKFQTLQFKITHTAMFKSEPKGSDRPVKALVVGAGQRGSGYAEYATDCPDLLKVLLI